jgi:hypothetical protein
MKRADKALERRAGPDHHEQRKLFIMAESTVTTIPLCLPCVEANALRTLIARLTLDGIERVAEGDIVFPDGRPESVVMWSALLILQGALHRSRRGGTD